MLYKYKDTIMCPYYGSFYTHKVCWGRGKWIIKLLQYVVYTRLHMWKQCEVNRKWMNVFYCLCICLLCLLSLNTIYFMIFFQLKTFPVWTMLACHNQLIFNLPLLVHIGTIIQNVWFGLSMYSYALRKKRRNDK